MIPSRFSFEH